MLTDNFNRGVRPLQGAAPYLGGKRILSKTIVPMIHACPHRTYVEVFVGMGGIFFRREIAPQQEVINDFGKEVANFFRVLQRHYIAFMDMMKFQISTRREFDRLRATDPATLTDLERAARFFYLQNLSFGGNPKHNSFGVSVGAPGRFDITRLGSHLEEIHDRLSAVVIECLDYADLIPRYDGAETLFYLDPPYWDGERDYGDGLFAKSDFQKMAGILSEVKGRFILSINDVPQIRKIFSEFHYQEVTLNYSVSKDTGKLAHELIITNYDPAEMGQQSLI